MTDQSFDFITHTEVFIAASPAEIWPHLLDTNSWRSAGHRLISDSGVPGEIGERFKAVSDGGGDGDSFHYYVVNVELAPGKRRTIRLVTPDQRLIGYASWALSAVDGGTRVEYHVYSQIEPPLDATGKPVPKERIFESFYQGVNAGFLALKQIIEN
jgi:hypothetical protein